MSATSAKSSSRKSNANKGISRIDSGSTHAWFVRGYKNGAVYCKTFSDLKCGGKTKALAQAREYRDQLHSELQSMPTKRKPRGSSKN